MTKRQNSFTQNLYEELPETQLDQIQGGGKPYNERTQNFTHEKMPDHIEDEGFDLVALNLQRARDH